MPFSRQRPLIPVRRLILAGALTSIALVGLFVFVA